MYNRVGIMGRLTADPELKHLQDGTAVCTARVAVDRGIRSKDGTRKTDFITINAWKGAAEFLANYFTKGKLIVVDGRLQTREWTDKDGNKRTAVEIQASSCYFGEPKRDDAPAHRDHSGFYAPATPLPIDDDDYELPFK